MLFYRSLTFKIKIFLLVNKRSMASINLENNGRYCPPLPPEFYYQNRLRLMNNNSYRRDTGKTTSLLLLIINILNYRTVVPASHDDVQKKRRVKEGFHEYIGTL